MTTCGKCGHRNWEINYVKRRPVCGLCGAELKFTNHDWRLKAEDEARKQAIVKQRELEE